MDLAGKTAIITGAGRGIGKAIAAALAKEGVKVALAARNKGQLFKTAKETGKNSLVVPTDITKEKSIINLVNKTIKKYGSIDILINNAGAGFAKPVLKTTEKDWDTIIDTNLKGAYLCSRIAGLEMIKKKKGGAIINISSSAGLKGYEHQGAYCASKHGMVGLSRVLAIELKPYNIKVHTICPGGVDTVFIDNIKPDLPKHELMKPEHIADLVIFLLKQPANATIEEILITRFIP